MLFLVHEPVANGSQLLLLGGLRAGTATGASGGLLAPREILIGYSCEFVVGGGGGVRLLVVTNNIRDDVVFIVAALLLAEMKTILR